VRGIEFKDGTAVMYDRSCNLLEANMKGDIIAKAVDITLINENINMTNKKIDIITINDVNINTNQISISNKDTNIANSGSFELIVDDQTSIISGENVTIKAGENTTVFIDAKGNVKIDSSEVIVNSGESVTIESPKVEVKSDEILLGNGTSHHGVVHENSPCPMWGCCHTILPSSKVKVSK
jgi:phage baseplate assembly protein gpV